MYVEVSFSEILSGLEQRLYRGGMSALASLLQM